MRNWALAVPEGRRCAVARQRRAPAGVPGHGCGQGGAQPHRQRTSGHHRQPRSPAVLAMHALAACVKCGTCIVQRCEHAPPSPAMPRCLCVMAVRWRPPLPRAGGSRRARHGVQRAHAARAVLKKICDHPALLSERMAGEVGAAGAAAPPCAPAQQALDSCKHADAGGHMGLPAHAELGSKNSRRARTDAHMGIVTFLWLSRGC